MPTALLFGASGQIGRFLLPRLRQNGWEVHAVSRQSGRRSRFGEQWHCMDLFGAGEAPAADVVFSLGPLDGLLAWLRRAGQRPARLVAFGSTSADTKQDSPDPKERALAHSLRAAELELQSLAADAAMRCTLLRPTLVYGVGMDHNLTRIAQLGSRWRILVLPATAVGLRQPVHAEDLANAAWQVAQVSTARAPAYDLPGGETLSYREMVQRVMGCLQPRARLVLAPAAPMRFALAGVHWLGLLPDAGHGVVRRMTRDLVFDSTPAARDFGYSPRLFKPDAGMFVAPE